MNEQQQTAANYILNFYEKIMELTQHIATYKNIILEVEQLKNSDINNAQLEENEKKTIISTAQNLKYYIETTYIMYQALKDNILTKNKKIDENYKEIEKQIIMDRKLVQQYTIELHKLLSQEVIKELIKISNKELITSIYQNETK